MAPNLTLAESHRRAHMQKSLDFINLQTSWHEDVLRICFWFVSLMLAPKRSFITQPQVLTGMEPAAARRLVKQVGCIVVLSSTCRLLKADWRAGVCTAAPCANSALASETQSVWISDSKQIQPVKLRKRRRKTGFSLSANVQNKEGKKTSNRTDHNFIV